MSMAFDILSDFNSSFAPLQSKVINKNFDILYILEFEYQNKKINPG